MAQASNNKPVDVSSDLPQHILIIITVFCALAGIIFIIVLVSITYCKILNKKEEEENPPESTEPSDVGPMIVALDNDNGSVVRTWYPEYRTSTESSLS